MAILKKKTSMILNDRNCCNYGNFETKSEPRNRNCCIYGNSVNDSDYLGSTKPLFNRLKTLNVFDMNTREVATFMSKYKNDMLPLSFNHFFTIHWDNHDYNTRNRDDFKFPVQKIETISPFGPKVWNELPKNVKQANTLNQFRSP